MFIPAMVIILLVMTLIIHSSVGDAEEDDRSEVLGSFGGQYSDIVYKENYLFAAQLTGVGIYDVSDSHDIIRVSFLHTNGTATSIDMQEDLIYVTGGEGTGFLVIDIEEPEDPQVVGWNSTQNSVNSVDIEGNYAYLTEQRDGLVILDITDPMNPMFVSRFDTSDAQMVMVSGDFAYIADDHSNLVIINVTDRSDPTLEGKYDPSGGDTSRIFIHEDTAYVELTGRGLQVVDITDRTDPKKITKIDASPNKCMAVNGNLLYLGLEYKGIEIYDTANLSDISYVGNFNESYKTTELIYHEDIIYLASGTNGFFLIDVNDPEHPQQICKYNANYYASSVLVLDELAYVASGYNGFNILNVEDPGNIQLVGHVYPGDYLNAVLVEGQYAYLGGRERGIYIVDISDPRNPAIIGNIDSFETGYRLYKVGNILYVASVLEGLILVDVSDKTNPTVISRYNETDYVYSIEVFGDYGYIADKEDGLVIVDLSDPYNIFKVGNISMESPTSYDVTIEGDRAYFMNFWDGLFILDISDPMDPQIIGNLTINGMSVQKSGDYVIIASQRSSVYVVDVSNETDPVLWANCKLFQTIGTIWNAHSVENRIYASSSTRGLIIADYYRIPEVIGWVATPNIAYSGMEVQFDAEVVTDCPIIRYQWNSSITGELYNGSDPSTTLTDLPVGVHTISLRVQDQRGSWSDEVRNTLIIHGRPIAMIESISLNPALTTDTINFVGNGTDDGTIIRYLWITDDVELYNGTDHEFSYSGLSIGTHTIRFKVQDDHDAWSEEVTDTLTIHERPIASIDSITPTSPTTATTIHFIGSGNDDGMITRYVWTSSFYGELYNGTESEFDANDLSAGSHTITLKVRDDNYVWSEEVVSSLVIEDDDGGNDGTKDDPEFLFDTIGPLPVIAYIIIICIVAIAGIGLLKRNRSAQDWDEEPQFTPSPPSAQQAQTSIPPPVPPSAPPGSQNLQSSGWQCPQCGNNVDLQYSFCLNCGYKRP